MTDEIQRLEARARLPKSSSANFIRVIGYIVIGVGIFALLLGGPFGLPALLAAGASGGFIIAAAALQQSVYDIRTMMLRAYDRQEDERNNSLPPEDDTDA